MYFLAKEEEILKLCSRAETFEKGFRLLVHTHQESIYRIIRQMVLNHEDANDIMQEVFIKVWRSLSKFRKESSLSTWIYRIAVNETFNFLKKQKRKQFFLSGDRTTMVMERLRSDPYFDGQEIEIKLQEALLQLPDRQRLVFNMRYYEDMKFDEIEEILGTSSGSLRASYHIAVKKVKKYLIED